MEMVENLVKTTLSEIEKVVNTKTVVGEPVTIGETTIVPLISIGFFFGAGGGSGRGEASQKGEGQAGGSGGGAWVRPAALVVMDSQGVRLEPVIGRLGGALEKLGEMIPDTLEKYWQRRKQE
jgi:uncharacterized spore protein YtfJ